MGARLDPATRHGLRLTLVAVAVVLVAGPFAALTALVRDDGALTRLDRRVADVLNGWVHGRAGAAGLLQAISWLGGSVALTLAVVFVVVLVWRPGHRRRGAYLVVAALGGSIVASLVKVAVDRSRPVVDHPVAEAVGQSFPSGHAMSSTVTYGAVLVTVWPWLSPRLRWVGSASAVVLVLLVGSSRLLLGVHHLSDVAGGYVLGLAWLAATTAAFAVWRPEQPAAAIEAGGGPAGAAR